MCLYKKSDPIRNLLIKYNSTWYCQISFLICEIRIYFSIPSHFHAKKLPTVRLFIYIIKQEKLYSSILKNKGWDFLASIDNDSCWFYKKANPNLK